MTHSNQIMKYIKITLSNQGEIKALLGLSLLTIGVSVRCLARAILLTFIAKVVPSFLHQSWCSLPRNHIELVHVFLWFSPIQFLICHLKVVGGNIRENTYPLFPPPPKFLLKGGEAGLCLEGAWVQQLAINKQFIIFFHVQLKKKQNPWGFLLEPTNPILSTLHFVVSSSNIYLHLHS